MPAYRPAALVILLWLLGIWGAAAEPLVATQARLGEHPDHTRFVIELSGTATYRVFTLADPYRVVLDLPEVAWQLPPDTGLTGKGLVKGYRYGRYRHSNSRVVLDLWKPAEIKEHFIIPPSEGKATVRLVINLGPVSRETFLKTAGWPDDVASGATAGTELQPRSGGSGAGAGAARRHLIVIDPGHGGVDPGAQGYSGSQEKEVVLDVGLVLRDLLVQDGAYDVVMTRDSDSFVSLKDRVNLARRSRADLFISLHADSIGKSGVRGASVYTLSEKASDTEAERLARTENAADIIAGADLSGESDEVRNILIDLAQRETKNFSVNFARKLTGELARETGVTERPHRFAGFKVLKAPDVPSVLLELGFLSDERDERAMTSAAWQERVARAIYRSIGEYFEDGRRLPISKPVPVPKRAPGQSVTMGATDLRPGL